jgi:hypothetical protein
MFTTFSSQSQQARQAVKSMLDQQLATLTTLNDEIARLEQTGLTTADAVIDESTKLAKDTLGAAVKARGDAQKLAEEAAATAWDAKAEAAFPALAAFRQLAEEQATRFSSMKDEAAKLEAEARTRAEDGAAEYARLLKETVHYGVQVSSEWRKLMVEATRRVADILIPSA